MPPRTRGENSSVYRLKVTLRYTYRPVWRRIQVGGDSTLAELHSILQTVMPWDNFHLHQFVVRGTSFLPLDRIDEWAVEEEHDENQAILRWVAPRPRTKFVYEYDFGDSWQHEILVEKIVPPQPDVRYPVCLGGAGACPPEDCGGIGGYYNMLQAIQNPEHPEYEYFKKWLGADFDPDVFDMDRVNRNLRKIS
jgi:hypothetical protein